MLDLTLDPSITPDMVDAAHAVTPVDYDQVFAEITSRLGQDDLVAEPRGLVAPQIRGPVQACLEARQWHEQGTSLGVGMCLATVRHYFNVAALWEDAETAGEHSAPLHRTSNPADFPRGSVGYAYNGRHGHVWLSVGGGLCWTTDYVRAGKVDLAPISAMAPWIGGRLIGWGEVLNGVDVWPDPKKPKPKPLTHAEKADIIRVRWHELQKSNHPKRAARVKRWLDDLEAAA